MAVYSFKDKPQALEPPSLKNSKKEGGMTMQAFLDVVEHEAAFSHLRKHENEERKARGRYF
jgi:hypothetical protein